nr:hypothetical protein [Tanacetum cinerariifolium]GFA40266.1 hypothetical protein [Tanacetum cinerariifolium]
VSGARFWIKMENKHELSYETLTSVYLGSYEHYKVVGAEVELLEPGFELQGSKMVEMGQFGIIREQIFAAYKGYKGGGVVVITVAKLMIKVVTTAITPITAAPVPKASALRKRKGVIIQDLKEAAIASLSVQSEVKSKDKGKGILVEEPKPLKRQAQI